MARGGGEAAPVRSSGNGSETEVVEATMKEGKALSVGERMDLLHVAFRDAFPQDEDNYMPMRILDAYDDHVIVHDRPLYYRVAYTLEDGGVMFAPRAEWQRVEKEWLEAKGLTDDEIMVWYGGEVKALGEGKVGGYLVRFGAPNDTDLTGDFFAADTDFDLEHGTTKSVYYHHGSDPTLGTRKLGKGTLTVSEEGLWLEAQLALRDNYERMVYGLVQEGKIGLSSGTAAHLMAREPAGKAYKITQWPIVEASLTPTPAEWRNAVVPLKSLPVQAIKSLMTEPEPEQPEALQPEASTKDAARSAAQDTGADVNTADANEKAAEQAATNDTDGAGKTVPIVEVRDMEENEKVQEQVEGQDNAKSLDERLAEMEEKFSKTLDGLLDKIEKAPALRSAGYYTEDGGAKDKNVKSFGDWLLALRRGDTKRLTAVYGSTKDMGEESGTSGGYLVPEEFQARLLQAAADNAIVRPRAEVIPVGSDAGSIPALDQFTAPTAGVGETAFAGGMTADIAQAGSEGGTLTETQPKFAKIEWRIRKIGDYVEVDNELVSDSPIAIESLLVRLFGVAVTAKEDFFFLRGTGVGMPLGILNSPAAIGVSPDTDNAFAETDALEMISRFRPNSPNAYWIMHKSVLPDLGGFEIGTGGSVYLRDQSVAPGTLPLFGYPILFTEHLPQADNSGCVVLADLGSYAIFDRSAMAIAYSEHVNFKTDQGVWRYTKRLDGKPWQKNVITQADPNGSFTTSPFVYFND